MSHCASPRRLICAYLLALLLFLMLDACWLSLTTPRLYLPALAPLMAPQPDLLAVALFYPAYVGGLLFFAIAPALEVRRAGLALGRGALFGLLAYATYDLTNQATLRGWPWMITGIDLLWGTALSGAVACAATDVVRRFTSRPGPQKALQ